LIETDSEIDPSELIGVNRVGVTAGASTPNWLIDQVVKRLREIGNRLSLEQQTSVN
jgi:4-hydroxy-3-methylbut-2-enyl diphosphate reductase